MNQDQFLLWELTNSQTIDFKMVYVDLCDDLIAGLLLSQIIYWHLPDKEKKKTKLRVKKEGYLWLAKGRGDWYEEIRVSVKQFDRASKILINKGIIEKKVFKFNADPMIHIRIIWENFLPLLQEKMQEQYNNEKAKEEEQEFEEEDLSLTAPWLLPKGEKGTLPKGNKEHDERAISLTKNTDKEQQTKNKENLNLNPNTDIINKLVDETELPDSLKNRIKFKMAYKMFSLTPDQIFLIEDAYAYQIQKSYVIPDCDIEFTGALNDREFSTTVIKMLETVKDIKNMRGLIQEWVQLAFENKLNRLS